ncbi:MAG TPA: acetyltransferase [Burkholderiales bacterium]|nr:acetyltransferase [Burkholderiales bacterium]
MRFYDIFNGDADGICALHQLRLAEPRDATLVTGVKRDIRLLERVPAEKGDRLTVLDISLRENAPALKQVLDRGAVVVYFDHHAAGEVPAHPALAAHIDTAPDVCTSLLVDRHLRGRHRAWAVVAAFGDNLAESALAAAAPLGLQPADVQRLRELGEAMNYNAYGETPDDLHYHPADLYEVVSRYANPFEFIAGEPVFEVLRAACADDLARAEEARQAAAGRTAAFVFPDAAWSRRIHGIFANRQALAHPERAHAVLVQSGGGYKVSVRAPLTRPAGAEALCSRFPTGGGREAAAGINHLPEAELEKFLREFAQAF